MLHSFNCKSILVSVLIALLVTSTVLSHDIFAKSKADKKAKNDIIKKLGRAVEGHYATIDMLNISKFNDNATIVVINKTGGISPPPPPPPPKCMDGWHYDPVSKECVQDNPIPTSGFKLCFVGDLSGNAVPDAMKQCNYRIGLGDLGYQSDLSWFKSLGFDKCVIGNHDAKEDSNSNIEKEALAYCGDSWWLKLANGTVLILGFNTNGDIGAQVSAAQTILSNSNLMLNVKTVIALSHKNGHVFPSAHHPAEASSLYSQLETMIPNGVTLSEVGGHNHDSASAEQKHWFIAGAGGKSFYSCGKDTDTDWTFCDNSHKAFLQFTIDNQGSITPNFYDTAGKIIH